MMRKTAFIIFVSILMLVIVTPAQAGQGFIINSAGDAVFWNNSASNPIVIDPEAGACGQLDNSAAISRITANLKSSWTDLTTVDLAFSFDTAVITIDVDGSNYQDFLSGVEGTTEQQDEDNAANGVFPLLFDNSTDNIIDAATGENNGRFSILGFANPTHFTSDLLHIDGGQIVINCYCLENASGDAEHSDCPAKHTLDDFDFVGVHEMGHAVNLDHDPTGTDLISDGDSSNDDFISTMFPLAVNSALQVTPMESDITVFSSLYPSSDFIDNSTYCKITGKIIGRFDDGSEKLGARCLNVFLENQDGNADDDFFNQSFISGEYAANVDDNPADGDTADDGECIDEGDCGQFVHYVQPGKSYVLKIKTINSAFSGGSGVSPCANGQLPVCNDTIIAACADGSDTAGCKACVKVETLTTNSAGENFATKLAAECLAGGDTVNYGAFLSNSISMLFVEGASGSSSSCSLSSLQNSTFKIQDLFLGILFGLMILGLYRFRRTPFGKGKRLRA